MCIDVFAEGFVSPAFPPLAESAVGVIGGANKSRSKNITRVDELNKIIPNHSTKVNGYGIIIKIVSPKS